MGQGSLVRMRARVASTLVADDLHNLWSYIKVARVKIGKPRARARGNPQRTRTDGKVKGAFHFVTLPRLWSRVKFQLSGKHNTEAVEAGLLFRESLSIHRHISFHLQPQPRIAFHNKFACRQQMAQRLLMLPTFCQCSLDGVNTPIRVTIMCKIY